jgi:ATP-binding cassette subfamily C protein
MRDYAVASALFSIGTAAALAVIVWFAMTRMALPTATVLLCIYLFARIVPRFNALLSSYRYLKNALPAYSNVRAMIAWTDANRAEPLIGATDVSLTRQVEIRDVTFQYPTARERVAVEDVSMRIGAGETVALVGRSGAGKSTLADLLLGLLEPSEGQVVIDGEPLAMENATAWRTRIGYVPQRTFLLHDTVCANLAWGAPGSTEGQMWEALRLAGAEDFVRRLPGELDAVIGDEGALLSGGEQQRLALARALLREPELLILDEATSALDFENERSILDALGELDGRIATLLITHRLQVAREADRIYVLEQGRIVEAGSWNDLMGRRGGTLLELLQAQAVKGAPEKPVETGAHEAVGVA